MIYSQLVQAVGPMPMAATSGGELCAGWVRHKLLHMLWETAVLSLYEACSACCRCRRGLRGLFIPALRPSTASISHCGDQGFSLSLESTKFHGCNSSHNNVTQQTPHLQCDCGPHDAKFSFSEYHNWWTIIFNQLHRMDQDSHIPF